MRHLTAVFLLAACGGGDGKNDTGDATTPTDTGYATTPTDTGDAPTPTDTVDSGSPQTVTVSDAQGVACLLSSDQVDLYDVGYGYDTDELVADVAPVVVVMFDSCVSGSAYNETVQCEVTLDGTALQVTGEASYDLPYTAVSDCNWLYAFCDAPVLAAGSYTLEYGGIDVPLDVPSSGAPPCTGDLF